MALIITFMFEPAKLQMNWARASGAMTRRMAPGVFVAGVGSVIGAATFRRVERLVEGDGPGGVHHESIGASEDTDAAVWRPPTIP
ncbi:hypothetical protein [Streptomyces sp. NPDC058674]|uniref:hypothetical protein n=1 Tax=Streptomyces sp. NPDC058674 TaxID=3346592 RepID=UPI0036577C64